MSLFSVTRSYRRTPHPWADDMWVNPHGQACCSGLALQGVSADGPEMLPRLVGEPGPGGAPLLWATQS